MITRRRATGFSLVETVVALGLFGFCVVVLLGLLGVGLRSARSVNQETVANMLASSIFAAWQIQENKAAPLTIPTVVSNLPALSTAGRREFYFDSDGRQKSDGSGAALQMSYQAAPTPVTPGSQLQLEFSWPPAAPTNAIQTRSFIGVFAP
jgi:uncharacterized protein (TIGR02598 family)